MSITKTIDINRSQFNKIMRISVILFLSIISLVANSFASETYAQIHRISLDLSNITLKEAFKEIEKNSDFVIFYYEGNLKANKKVSITVKEQTIDEVLLELHE